MRCYTCGFTNTDGSKVCEKCGTKLKAPAVADPAVASNQAYAKPQSPYNGGGIPTMRGSIAEQPAWDVDTQTKFKCEACGHYPLKNEVSKEFPCPNCKATGEKPIHNGTMKIPNIFFGSGAATSTTPKVTLVDISTEKALEFEGEDLILNRANLHPTDQSISSGQHVQFTKEKDTWHITDLSSNNATFLQVVGKVPVESGTHILIGNRIYRIELE